MKQLDQIDLIQGDGSNEEVGTERERKWLQKPFANLDASLGISVRDGV